ncbi:MAG: hypothetical protein K8L99_08155 [Anaerolineae bacterium]|nr:hypothetical protein [Anaerolineae bacterium]
MEAQTEKAAVREQVNKQPVAGAAQQAVSPHSLPQRINQTLLRWIQMIARWQQ